MIELVGITIAVDSEGLSRAGGLAYLAGASAHWGLYSLILFFALTSAFAWPSVGMVLRKRQAGLSWPVIFPAAAATHAVAYGVFCYSSVILCRAGTPPAHRNWLALIAVASGMLTVCTVFLVLIPAGFWKRLWQAAPLAPLAGLGGALAAAGVYQATGWLGNPWLHGSYRAAETCLRWLRSDVVADPARFILGTSKFDVEISPACSGYEGVAMMLAFGSAWLWFFRRDVRFPQALLLIPGGMAAIWLLNCARLVSLILIGSAGAPQIATGGFHSQAGWIAFVGMAIVFSVVCQKLPGIAASSAKPARVLAGTTDETPAFLLPFLLILGAGMVAQAVSSGFEWFYPLRVVAAGLALACYRRSYVSLDWRAGWESIVIGAVVFVLWIGADRVLQPNAAPVPTPAALAAAPWLARLIWLLFRIAGTVITVPIAEELAFRSYLKRRLIAASFTTVDPRRFTLLSFSVSSILFGVLHGQRWIAGILAGMLYGWVLQRRGRLRDAVVAHSTTNAMLVVWVLFTSDWKYW